MPAHALILWPTVLAATALGAGVVGRRLGRARRWVLWVLALGLTPAVVRVFPTWVESVAPTSAGELRWLSLVPAGVVLVSWGTMEVLAQLGGLDRLVVVVERASVALAVAIPIGFLWLWGLLASNGGEPGGGPLWLVAGAVIWVGTWLVRLGPLWASLLPLTVAWPDPSTEPRTLVRRAAPVLLIVVLAVASGAFVATRSLEVGAHEDDAPTAVNVRIDVEATIHERAGTVTVPFVTAPANASPEARELVDELRETVLFGTQADRSDARLIEEGRWLTMEVQRQVRLVAAGHVERPPEGVVEVAGELQLAGTNATVEHPDGVVVYVQGAASPSGCAHLLRHELGVLSPGNRTTSSVPVPLVWQPHPTCE